MKILFYCLLLFSMQSTITSEDITLQNVLNLMHDSNNKITISDFSSEKLSVLLFSPELNDKKMKLKLRKLPFHKLNEAKNNYSIVNGCFKKKASSFTTSETTKKPVDN